MGIEPGAARFYRSEIHPAEIPQDPVVEIKAFDGELAVLFQKFPHAVAGELSGALPGEVEGLVQLGGVDPRKANVHDEASVRDLHRVPVFDFKDLHRKLHGPEVCKIYPHPEKAQQGEENLIGMGHSHSFTGNAGAL